MRASPHFAIPHFSVQFLEYLAGSTPLQKQKGQMSNPAASPFPVSLLSSSQIIQPLARLLLNVPRNPRERWWEDWSLTSAQPHPSL